MDHQSGARTLNRRLRERGLFVWVRGLLPLLFLGVLILWPVRASGADRVLGGIGFDERLSSEAVLADDVLPVALGSEPVGVALITVCALEAVRQRGRRERLRHAR